MASHFAKTALSATSSSWATGKPITLLACFTILFSLPLFFAVKPLNHARQQKQITDRMTL